MKDVFQMIQSSSPQLPLCRVDLVDLPVHRYSVDIFHILVLQLLISFQMIKKPSVLFHFKRDHYETGFIDIIKFEKHFLNSTTDTQS